MSHPDKNCSFGYTCRNVTGAVWCDPEKYPEWNALPNSFFDLYRNQSRTWQHALLEFRFFYEWDGTSACELDFSGGCRFRLLINGDFVEDGPVEAGGDYGKTDAPDWWFGDSRKITSLLKPGRNEFRFQVVPVPLVQTDYSTGYGWIWCVIRTPDGSFTPADWQFRITPSYGKCAWNDREDDATDWQSNACVQVPVHHPVWFMNQPPLTNRKTALQYLFPFGKGDNIKVAGKKLFIKPGRPATFFLKLPRIAAGHFDVRANGQHSMRISFEFQELYGVKPDQTAVEYFTSKPGESSYRTFRIYPCRTIQVSVVPSGFFTPSDSEEAVALEFCFYERAWRFGRKQPIEKLPEPWLKKLDDHCLDMLRVCMQRLHLDSPAHQEGLGCTGDYRIGAGIAALAYRELRLTKADLFRTSLLLRQQGKMFHTSYELCFVLMMQEYVERAQDKSFAKACYDAVRIVYDHFKPMTGPEGLISQAENYLFIDWAVEGNMTYHHPPANRGTAAMTALWYGALLAMKKIAVLIGNDEDAEQFSKDAKETRRAFNSILWDLEKQAYLDGIPGLSKVPASYWLPADDGKRICTNVGNIMALAFGLPEAQHQPETLLHRVVAGEFPIRTTIYYMEYLFMAACRYHLPDPEKMQLLSLWKPFLKDGIRESWLAGDYSHMWSASPAYWLRTKNFFEK